MIATPSPPTLGAVASEFRDASPDVLLEKFVAWTEARGLTLYAAQEEALLELASGKNVIVNTPTGSGKSLVATFAHFLALASGRRTFYTCPIKALVSEKFFALCKDFGADDVGMMTGDGAVNRDAPIVCCTAEVLANMALRDGERADVDDVVMDEFHYYGDRDRGVAWQVPLLTLPHVRFTLMSATFGDPEPFAETLTSLTGRETSIVRGLTRPVPLEFVYEESPLHETVRALVTRGKAPVYLVNFTQRAAAEEAQNLMSVDFSTKEEKKAIAEALVGMRWDSPYGKEIQRFVRHGVGLHHAGLLPKYRLAVEKLAQRGLLKVISGTDTLGVGVNIPIRTVLFTKLCKFDGQNTAILSVRDFQQISGRAGRKGFDDAGTVIAQAPEHVIENLRLEAKAGSDPAKRRKLVKKKPPDRGYVHWDRTTFDKLVGGTPEPLVSRFQVTHGMLLNVLGRPEGGCMPMARLLRDNHDRPHQKRAHAKTAVQMLKSLVDAGIVVSEPGEGVRVDADLQEDFSLHHALSLWLVETIGKLDPDSGTYALDLLTLVESILENPKFILERQVDRLKTKKMGEMKAAGVPYEERIEELDKVEYEKPNAAFVYDTFNAFARVHPWVGSENIAPKSIARAMFEEFMNFSEYVRELELARGEGLLLRYLSEVYKTLVQTVPDADKTEDVHDIVDYFGAIVRQVDSSLLDEWTARRRGESEPAPADTTSLEPEGSKDVTTDRREFRVLVRNAVFGVLRSLARREWEAAAQAFVPTDPATPSSAPTAKTMEEAFAPYFAEHAVLRVDANARRPSWVRIDEGDDTWDVAWTLTDEEDATPFFLDVKVDLPRSRATGAVALTFHGLGR
ncbi:MAG: DUF3516 domain-containing protein [Polyangiaceae bacterium]